MSKYSYELKKKVVQDYLDGVGGYKALRNKYGLPHHNLVYTWISKYKRNGYEGLKSGRGKQKYTFEYKLRMVELYTTGNLSYQDIATQENINDPSIIAMWVKRFIELGIDGLKPKKKGPSKNMNNKSNDTSKDILNPTKRTEFESLKARVRHLEIENAYLKELRRLRMLEQQLQNKKQESFIVSEDDSN